MKPPFVLVLALSLAGIGAAALAQPSPAEPNPLPTKNEMAPERGRRAPFPSRPGSHADAAGHDRSRYDGMDEPSAEHGHAGGRGGGSRGDDDGDDE
jgi:hypothetical protein